MSTRVRGSPRSDRLFTLAKRPLSRWGSRRPQAASDVSRCVSCSSHCLCFANHQSIALLALTLLACIVSTKRDTEQCFTSFFFLLQPGSLLGWRGWQLAHIAHSLGIAPSNVSCFPLNNSTVQTGATPLYIACQNGHKDVAVALIGAGANVDSATSVRICVTTPQHCFFPPRSCAHLPG